MGDSCKLADVRTAESMIHNISGMLRISMSNRFKLDEARGIRRLYKVNYFYGPFNFVVPDSNCRVEVSTGQFQPLLIKLFNGDTLESDCYLSSDKIVIGENYWPKGSRDSNTRVQIWGNYLQGELRGVFVTYIEGEGRTFMSSHKEGDDWQVLFSPINIESDIIEYCSNLLGSPIPENVNPKEQLASFLQRSGLYNLQRDLKAALSEYLSAKP